MSANYTRWARKRASALLNASGCSRFDRCPAPRNDDELGAGDARLHPLGKLRRRERVLVADDDERGAADRFEHGGRIRPAPQRESAPAIASVELAQDQDRRVCCTSSGLSRRVDSPRRRGSISRRRRWRLWRARARASAPALDRPRSVGLRPGVGKNQRAEIPGRMAEQRKRDVAAHRQAADHRLVDVQPIEQVDDVAGVVVDRFSRRIAGAAVEAAELWGDDAPALFGISELSAPTSARSSGTRGSERACPARAPEERLPDISSVRVFASTIYDLRSKWKVEVSGKYES